MEFSILYLNTQPIFPAADRIDAFGQPMRAPGSDYLRPSQGHNYFREHNIFISAANRRICYRQTVYNDILDEPMEYFGLTLVVFREVPEDDDAQIKPEYNTAAVRILDDDGRMYIHVHLLPL